MDEIQLVSQIYAEPPQPDVAAARARLDALTRPRRSKLRWAVPSGVGLVGAAAAVAVVVSGTSTPQRHAPRAESARTVLLDAALKADHQTVPSGRYWHTSTRSREVQHAAAGYQVVSITRSESWETNGGKVWAKGVVGGVRPLTAADEAAWRKAGSPKEIVMVDGKRRKITAERPFTQGPGESDGSVPTLGQLRGLPSDAGKLRAWLLALPGSPTNRKEPQTKSDAYQRWAKKHHKPAPKPSGAPAAPTWYVNSWLYDQGARLILDAPVTTHQRAGLYRMLAQVPGVKLLGPVKDTDGRTGTGVAMTDVDPTGKPGQAQRRLIIDKASGRAIASDAITARGSNSADDTYPGFPAGVIVYSTTVRSAGWTNSR